MILCAACRSIVLVSTRPRSYVLGELAGRAFCLHRICINDWLFERKRA